MGSSFGVWEAWASDEAVRHRGSSGGALTALHGWLLESGRASTIASASIGSEPPANRPGHDHDEGGCARGCGLALRDRWASSSNPDVVSGDAITGKPCEISAIRALGTSARPPGAEAGRSSSRSSAPARRRRTRPTSSWRRSAWRADNPSPTSGTAVEDGPADSPFAGAHGDASLSYEESWGGVLGPSTHWRCKVCADGVGESGDLVAADFWSVDERGYPVFTEGAGSSALIARTERGLEAVLAAAAAGAIVRTADPDVGARERAAAAAESPHVALRPPPRKPSRRGARTALPRLPTLGALALAHPRLNLRAARGTRARLRRSSRQDRTGIRAVIGRATTISVPRPTGSRSSS